MLAVNLLFSCFSYLNAPGKSAIMLPVLAQQVHLFLTAMRDDFLIGYWSLIQAQYATPCLGPIDTLVNLGLYLASQQAWWCRPETAGYN